MAFNAKILLDTRRAKKDGSFPLSLRLTVNRKSTSISLNLSILEKDWDEKNERIRKSYKGAENVSRLNNRLQKKRTEALDLLFKLEDEKKLETLRLTDIKKVLLNKKKGQTLFSLGNQLVAEYKSKGKVGNARVYQETLNWVRNYMGDKDWEFKQISYTWLKRLETKYLAAGKSLNGLSVRMRTVRSIYNRAIREGIVSKDAYPFDKYTIKQSPTRKRAISAADLKKIRKAVLHDRQMQRAQSYFMISYYLMGASFIDLAFLKVKNIQDGRIAYRRRKTDKLYNIKITAQLESLLSPFLNEKSADDFILPIIKRPGNVELEYKDINNNMRQYNKDLKKMAKHLGIESDSFSSYVSRHTFATVARDKDVPVAVISKMLGHGDLKTTEIYLDGLKNEVLDDAMEQMLGDD